MNECIIKFRQVEDHAKIKPIDSRTFKTQFFQQALLKAFNKDDFNFCKFKKGLSNNDHMLNEFNRCNDLYLEVIRLEGLG